MPTTSRDKGDTFAPMPTPVLKSQKLTAQAKLVFAFIYGFQRNRQECFASNEHIGASTGCNADTVKRALKCLEKNGFLERSGGTSSRKLRVKITPSEPQLGAKTTPSTRGESRTHIRQEELDKDTRLVLDNKLGVKIAPGGNTSPYGSERLDKAANEQFRVNGNGVAKFPDDNVLACANNRWDIRDVHPGDFDDIRSGDYVPFGPLLEEA